MRIFVSMTAPAMALALAAASMAQAESAAPNTLDASGRFHMEVTQTEGYGFRATAIPTHERDPMQPVNEAGLHLSCIFIPDVLGVTLSEAQVALQTAADRYCRAQYGNDHLADLEGIAPHAAFEGYSSRGTCMQAPM